MGGADSGSAKVALVTGAARGIGRGIARALAEAGYDIVVNDVLPTADTAASVREAGRQALEVTADITDEVQVRAMIGRVDAELGRLDLLVNNAGVEIHKRIEEFTLAEWRRVIDVNLTGAFLCSTAALNLLEAAGSSCVVCITSVHEYHPKVGTAPYCVAKAGLAMLVKNLALEWARYGIRVVGLAPGTVETEINRKELAETREMCLDWIPLGRFAEPSEIGDAVVWIASDKAAYITGTTIVVDGGVWQAFHPLDVSGK